MSLFSSCVKKELPAVRQIYDAHNVDSNLWRQLANAQNNTEYNGYSKTALKNEKQLYKMVNAVFCCSEPDQQIFINLNKGLVCSCIIPNGVDTVEKRFDPNPDKYLSLEILFCGGLDYYPNEEGIRWFYDKVFPLVQSSIPGVRLTLVGKSPLILGGGSIEQDPSVEIVGMVTDVQPFYKRASVCIAPLLSGSGTRLKILEAMSMGNPVVATSIGSEGISYTDGKNILIADSPEIFAFQILKLLSDKALFEHLRFEARQMVNERYEWSNIGLQVNEAIENLLKVPNAN
jgi:glycosyltransferase involved in cell wall biosynthesis